MNIQIFYLVIINVFACMGYAFLCPLFPLMAEEHFISDSLLGYIIGIYPLVQALFSPFIPYFVKMIGRKKIMFYCALFQAFCVFCYGLINKINNYGLLIISLFLLRIFHAFGSAVVCTLVYSIGPIVAEKDNVQKDMAYVELGASCSGAIGPAVAGFFYNIGGFNFAFFALGLILIVNSYVVHLLEIDKKDINIRNNDEKNENKKLSNSLYETITSDNINDNNSIINNENTTNVSIFQYFKNLEILLYLILMVLTIVDVSFYNPVYTIHLINHWKMTIGECSIYFTINPIFYIIGLQFLSWASSKFGRYLSIVIAIFLVSIGPLFLFPVYFLPQYKLTLIIGMAILGFNSSFIFVPSLLLIKDLISKINPNLDEGTVGDISSSIFKVDMSLGDMCAPIYGGVMTDVLGFEKTCLYLSIFGIIFSVYLSYYYRGKLKENFNNFWKGVPQNDFINDNSGSFIKTKKKGNTNNDEALNSHKSFSSDSFSFRQISRISLGNY